jgi:CheY-like chemotaxis protein
MRDKVFFLIDDDEDDREFFKIALESINAATIFTSAADCCEAIKILESKILRPDYIFLDLNMPNMDGKACLVELRKSIHLLNIPVIIFTTSADKNDREQTARLGAAGFITKPSKISDLAELLKSFATETYKQTNTTQL